MAFVITDIETAPLQDVDVWLPEFKPAGNIKDAEKRAANVAEKREKAISEAALDADLCRIVALGAWWPDDPHPTIYLCGTEDEEREALREFWEIWTLEKRRNLNLQLTGYNVLSFDIVVMLRRSLYLGVKAPVLHRGRYRHDDVCDLWSLLSEDGTLPWRTLSYYHKRLGCPPVADTITGADVPACVARGEWDKVRAHLLADLVRTRDVARRMGVLAQETVHAA
ncbi:MAG TPA: hypothetical protein VHP62_01890 [Usitatibacter sp.]|jgi:predicted PolB exonuclease-like 3'-5' exonuclease|nr:hypothetical protein [Usitatibacter sp.]